MSNDTGEIEIEKLITAVRTGDEDKVSQFLSVFQEKDQILSALLPWDEGYDLLRVSLKEKRRNIAKLLLNHGVKVSRINSKQVHNSPFYLSVSNEDIEIAEMIIAKGVDINYKNSSGKLPIFVAIEKNNEKLIRLLLAQKNILVNSKTYAVPLEAAVKVNNQKIFNLLLRHGASTKLKYSDGNTMLQIAVEKGYLSTVESILNKCSNLHRQAKNNNLLAAALARQGEEFKRIVDLLVHYGFTIHPNYKDDNALLAGAVQHNQYKIAEELLKLGADVNNFSFHSPVIIACDEGLKKFLKLLIKYGADLEVKDIYNFRNPLTIAIDRSDVEITKLLLKNKVTIDQTILHCAVRNGSTEIVKLLLDHGAMVHGVDCCGRTALHQVAWNTKWNTSKESVEIAKLLLNKGANLYAKCNSGKTPLEFAVKNEKVQILKVFIGALEDVNAAYIGNPRQLPLLHYACMDGKASSIRAILSCKANVNQLTKISSEKKTPLHFAAKSNVACEILLKNNANVNAKDDTGRTPLHIFILEEANINVIETLLKNNADVNAIDKDGLTPLVIASRRNCPNYIDILLKYQANIYSVSKAGKTAMHYFIDHLNQDGVEKLLNYNFDTEKTCRGYDVLYFISVIAKYYRNYNVSQVSTTRSGEKLKQCIKMIELVRKHIIKIFSLRFLMNSEELDGNKIFLNKLYISPHENITYFINFHELCKNELMLMQENKIGSSGITFYYLLKKSIHQIARYAENSSIRQVFEDNFPEEKFPIYKEMIKIRFQMGLYRKEILDKDTESCIYAYFKNLPYNCCEEIFGYLDNLSLTNLIIASQAEEKLHQPKTSKNKPVGRCVKKRRNF